MLWARGIKMENAEYRSRIIDDAIERYVRVFGAICIEGPKFYARTLKEPCFDIHCAARENSAPSSTRDSIPYVMIISLETPKENDFRKKF
jgi:hypothetical protein